MLKGIDVSKWNNWQDRFKDYDFIMIRAMGTGGKDSKLDSHFNALAGNTSGKPLPDKCYGFYCFPDVTKSAIDEADEFLSYVGHHAGHAMFALDWEGSALNGGVDWALAWLNRVYERTGVKPLIYGSASELSQSKYKVIHDNDYGLWVAHWTNASSPKSGHWGSYWAIWQYTSNNGTLDENWFNGSKEAWKKFCNPGESSTVKPSKPAESKTYYTVQSGDNLTKIAKKFNTTVNAIVALNPGKITDPDYIQTGWYIRVL